jgi:GT2 family glycosyltransferase
MARTTAEHYRHVIGLAASEAASAGGPPDRHTGPDGPLLSFVVPTFDTQPRHLGELMDSYLSQATPETEIVLSDDGSGSVATRQCLARWDGVRGVTVVRHPVNTGIAGATNRGVAAATGQWIGLVDHDDVLSPYAVRRLTDTLARHPAADFVYTDELIADENLEPLGYHLKPAFDRVLLSGVNYVNHLSLYRRDRLVRLGGLREGFDGSQDYDLLLRYLHGLPADRVVHLPFPAYVWRRSAAAFSSRFKQRAVDAARRSLAEHFAEAPGALAVESAGESDLHRLRLDLTVAHWPLVSAVIPNRDSYELISRVLGDLETKTDYPNLEIIVVDNGTTDPRVLELYRTWTQRGGRFRVVIEPRDFNFARQVNDGMRLATGAFVLLLNNDVEVLSADWLREMVCCFSYGHVGIVGAKLLYPDRTLQHAGVIVGFGGLAGHWFEGKPADFPGPFGRLWVRQTLSAVTGACMLVSRECIDAVGELDAASFAIAYNDIDYCLRAAKQGYATIWTPFATLIHRQSASRGSDETAANRGRFQREKDALRRVHGTAEHVDPYSSPWYTRNRSEPGLLLLAKLPEARTGGPWSVGDPLP